MTKLDTLPPLKNALALNNPARIRHSLVDWPGMVVGAQNHPQLVEFLRPEDGLFAMARVVLTFRHKRPLTCKVLSTAWLNSGNSSHAAVDATNQMTLEKMLSLHLKPFQVKEVNLEEHGQLLETIQSILRFEYGSPPYGFASIALGVNLALKKIEQQTVTRANWNRVRKSPRNLLNGSSLLNRHREIAEALFQVKPESLRTECNNP